MAGLVIGITKIAKECLSVAQKKINNAKEQ